MKGEQTEKKLPDFVKSIGEVDRVIFTSFWHCRVLEVKKKLTNATTGILINCNPANAIQMLEAASADNLHVNYRFIDKTLVSEVHDAGKRIIPWGKIVEIPVIDRLIDLNVDAIGSDRPELVIDRLKKRGLWNKE